MYCRTPKEVQEDLVQHLNNNLAPLSRVDYDLDTFLDFEWNIEGLSTLKLYGVQYIGQCVNTYKYEAVILDEYKPKVSDIIFIYNIITLDTIIEESQIEQISDTCLHFVLSQYYNPSIYKFLIDSLWS